MTCAEWQNLKNLKESELSTATSERDAAQSDVNVCDTAVVAALDDQATANIVLAGKQATVDSLTTTISYITSMMVYQGC